jgi:hypothetical protein
MVLSWRSRVGFRELVQMMVEFRPEAGRAGTPLRLDAYGHDPAMRPITFSVPGKPVPQPRPRITRAGRSVLTPDNGIEEYRSAIAAACREVCDAPAEQSPLTMIVDWVLQCGPKSHFPQGRHATPWRACAAAWRQQEPAERC